MDEDELEDAFDDADLDGEDGGSFADNDNVFTNGGPDDPDEGAEGVFREDASVFSTPQSRPEPHQNRLTNQAEEDAQYQVPKPTALQRAKQEGTLVAKWNSKNPADFSVAWTVDGKRVEAWRAPTRGEFEKFKQRGRWLKGGVKQGVGDVATADASVDAQTFWQKNKTKIIGGVAIVGGGLGLWWLWKKYWAEADGDVVESR